MRSRRALLRGLSAATVGFSGVAPASAESATEVTLHVTPETTAFDEPVRTRVTGLEAGTEVTLAARMRDRDGRQWASVATFAATDAGEVDTHRHAPTAGTYEEVRPMGLVWSMRPTDGDASVFVPPRGGPELTVTARAGGDRVDERTVRRRFGPADLRVEESPDGLVGSLFRPAGEGPFPGVIALHGSGGEPMAGTAIMLAAHGYAVFAPQYFGSPAPLPDQLAEVPLEYLQQSVEWLRELPAVSAESVSLVGGSKGAELALLAGAAFDWANAVAAYAPSGVVWAGLTYGGEVTSSWTLDGDPVPYVETAFPPRVVADYLVSWPLGEPASLRPTYTEALANESRERIEEATIPVEEIDGPVALVAGGDDELWPSARLGTIAAERLEANDHPHAVRDLVYDDAGHAVSYPYQPTTGLTGLGEQLPGVAIAAGGTPSGYARAARESWPAVLRTIEEGHDGED